MIRFQSWTCKKIEKNVKEVIIRLKVSPDDDERFDDESFLKNPKYYPFK